MELAKQLGMRIAELRRERGLTQEALAYTSDGGISSKGYLSDIESGKRLPSLGALEALASALGVDLVDFFVSGDGLRAQVVQATRTATDDQLTDVLRLLRGTDATD